MRLLLYTALAPYPVQCTHTYTCAAARWVVKVSMVHAGNCEGEMALDL